MNRREFVAGSAAAMAAVATAGTAGKASAQQQRRAREHYEVRTITFANKAALDRYAAFLKDAFVPAAGRAGMGPVGIFGVADKPDDLSLYLLLSYPSMAVYRQAEDKMLEDAEFNRAGASVLDLPATDPPYSKMECSLLAAFQSHPKLTPPKEAAGNAPRVFELRIYESHSRKANKKKIEMFDQGETAIFERAGFQPVFFGECLAGPQVPNLTYMVTYSSLEDRGKYWQRFLADPEKARLFAIPEYADKLIVSRIRSVNLKPLPGSQV